MTEWQSLRAGTAGRPSRSESYAQATTKALGLVSDSMMESQDTCWSAFLRLVLLSKALGDAELGDSVFHL